MGYKGIYSPKIATQLLFALLLDDALKPATPLLSSVAGLSASSSSKEDTLNI